MECKNKEECKLHTPVAHIASCGTSGTAKCRDHLHLKTCHTEEDLK